MEKKFLLHLLHIALIDIRGRSYEQNDRKTFWLCDLLHKIPLRLATEQGIREAYKTLSENIKTLGIEHWLDIRKEEFYDQYHQYKE